MNDDDVDTMNRQGVGMRGERVVILSLRADFSKGEALNLAAWIVALADEDGAFARLLRAVRNT